MSVKYTTDLIADDVIIWVVAAITAIAISVTLVVSHNKSLVNHNCINDTQRAEAGILIDTSDNRYAKLCGKIHTS